KVQAAQRAGIDVTDADVEATYAVMARRMRLSSEQLTAALAGKGVDAATLRHRIRADLAWRQVVRNSRSPHAPTDEPAPPNKKDDGLFAPRDQPPREKRDEAPSWRE